jgi:hypothetical protein
VIIKIFNRFYAQLDEGFWFEFFSGSTEGAFGDLSVKSF